MRAPCLCLAGSMLLVAQVSFAQPAEPAPGPEAPLPAPDAEAVSPGSEPAPEPGLAPPPGPGPAPGLAPAPHGAVPWYPATSGTGHIPYQPPPEEPSEPSRDMSRDFWQVHLGARVSWIPNDGYNPFDENDVSGQLSIGGSRAWVLGTQFSFAPGVLWEVGTVSSKARGADSELTVHRLGAVAEGRFHLVRDVYLLAKLIPHAVHTRAYLNDASFPDQLQQRTWRFGMDASAGAAWNVPRTLGARNALPQFWLVGECGYGWTMSKDLVLKPDVDEDDPRARTELDLGPMALRGVMMRVSAAMTF